MKFKMIIFMVFLMAFTFFAWRTVSNSKEESLYGDIRELKSQIEVLQVSNEELTAQNNNYKQLLIDNNLIEKTEVTEEASE